MDCSKAFHNFRANGIHLNFPNGNSVSTIWGSGSYTENYDYASPRGLLQNYSDFLQSNDVEVMFDAGPKLTARIEKKYGNGAQPLARLNITSWLQIVNLIAGEKPASPRNPDLIESGNTTKEE